MFTASISRSLSGTAVFALAVLVACADSGSPVGPGSPGSPAPATGSVSLVAHIDGHDYLASRDSGFAVGEIPINKGGIVLRAAALNGTGTLSAPFTAENYELRVMGGPSGAPLPAAVEFTRYDAFSGSLYWIAPGQTVTLYLGLVRRQTDSTELGPFAVAVHRLPHDQ